MSEKSSYLNLYDDETKQVRFFRVECKLNKVKFDSAEDYHVDLATDKKFYVNGTDFMASIEQNQQDITVESAAARAAEQVNAQNIATNAVGYAAGDATLDAKIDAEIIRASQAEANLATAVTTVDADYKAADTTLDAKIDQEIADRQTAVAAEVADRQLAVQGVQDQITNILSNSDPASLDSLSEIVAAFQNADSTLTGTLSAVEVRLAAVEAQLAALLDE